jgi:hypothetical protein
MVGDIDESQKDSEPVLALQVPDSIVDILGVQAMILEAGVRTVRQRSGSKISVNADTAYLRNRAHVVVPIT